MDEETHEGLFRPEEKINQRYGSIANEPEENQTLFTNTNSKVPSQRRAYIAVAVLCYVNMLNYMDRYTIAGKGCSLTPKTLKNHGVLYLTHILFWIVGVLPSLQKYFSISDSTSGLLQTGIRRTYVIRPNIYMHVDSFSICAFNSTPC